MTAWVFFLFFTGAIGIHVAKEVHEKNLRDCIEGIDRMYGDTCGEADAENQADCVFEQVDQCLSGEAFWNE